LYIIFASILQEWRNIIYILEREFTNFSFLHMSMKSAKKFNQNSIPLFRHFLTE